MLFNNKESYKSHFILVDTVWRGRIIKIINRNKKRILVKLSFLRFSRRFP